MTHRFEAIMNDIPLTSIGGIVITDISCKPAQLKVNTATAAQMDGERILQKRRESSAVTITFVIHAEDPVAQQEKCMEAAAWARSGRLQISTRPGQQLRCICTDPPTLKNAVNRAERIQMTFTAYEQPCWEDTVPAEAELTGTSGNGTLFVPGNVEGGTEVEIEAKPSSGTLDHLTLTVAGHTIELNSLGATAANPLRITYDDHRIQSIQVGNVPAMSKRTPASADDLMAVIGSRNVISMTADTAASVQFYARGKWL